MSNVTGERSWRNCGHALSVAPGFDENVKPMTEPLTPRKRIQLHFDVADETQAAELSAAWQEIVSGRRTRLATAAEGTNEIMERARVALQVIVKVIEEHPGTGQSRRLVRFLAGVYNGHEFHFDPTDLRAMDRELANASIDYLNYDRLAKAEVHTHLPGGGRQMQGLIAEQGIRARPHLSDSDEHESRLFALAQRLEREADAAQGGARGFAVTVRIKDVRWVDGDAEITG